MKSLRYGLGLFGALLLAGSTARAATLYVWQDSTSPTSPFTNWVTAAHTIQDAVDAARPLDTVLVTNGVYDTGATRPAAGVAHTAERSSAAP